MEDRSYHASPQGDDISFEQGNRALWQLFLFVAYSKK